MSREIAVSKNCLSDGEIEYFRLSPDSPKSELINMLGLGLCNKHHAFNQAEIHIILRSMNMKQFAAPYVAPPTRTFCSFSSRVSVHEFQNRTGSY